MAARNHFPRWISWLFLICLAYLIYLGNQHQRVKPAAPQAEPPAAISGTDLSNYPSLQAFTNSNRWQRAIDPNYVGDTKINDTKPGTGRAAQCGDQVSIHLRGTLSDGANFDEKHDESKPLTFRLGNAPYPVLNDALIGMRQEGVRQISAPPQQVYAHPTTREDVLLRVSLDTLETDPIPDTPFTPRIYIDQEGKGEPASCGAPMQLRFTLWNAKGGVASSSEPLTLSLGKDALPQALSFGLSGMRVEEQRTIVFTAASGTPSTAALPAPIRSALQHEGMVVLSVKRVK